jgi:hypothetical protein
MSLMFTGLAEERLHWTTHNDYVCVFYRLILAAVYWHIWTRMCITLLV